MRTAAIWGAWMRLAGGSIARSAKTRPVLAGRSPLPILAAMALQNLWGLYNLSSSPYFQATLRADSQAMPLRLFVGRQLER